VAVAGRCPPATSALATRATPDLLYNTHIKHLQYIFEKDETLETYMYSHSNICNIQMKTLAIYV
jgi:hypothetical protein